MGTAVWTAGCAIILATIIILFCALCFSVLYYRKIVEPNSDKSFWKIRRPKLYAVSVIVPLVGDLLKCINILLFDLNIIDFFSYSLTGTVIGYYGGITFGSIRIWLLYYDLKSSRKEQKYLLSNELKSKNESQYPTIKATISSTIDAGKRHKWGSYKMLLIRVLIIVTILCIFTLIIDLIGYPQTSKFIVLLYVSLFLIFYTYFLFSINSCCNCCKCFCFCFYCFCCSNRKQKEKQKNILKTSTFRDDWLLLLELTLIWIVWLLGLVAGYYITILQTNQRLKNVYLAVIFVLGRIGILSATFSVPYFVLRKLNKKNISKKLQNRVKILQKILSRKSYFFSFVEHLVHEFSIENLTFLVELWQFKYQEKYDLKQIDEEKTNDHKQSQSNDEWNEFNSTISDIEEESQLSQSGSVMTKADEIAIEIINKFLSELPWSRLPCVLINIDDKWDQCQKIYSKYINIGSYDSVNIGYAARDNISYNYGLLRNYALKKKDGSQTPDTPNTPQKINPDMIEMVIVENDNNITNDEQFNNKLISVFDAALNDIVMNLNDAVSRFMETEQFKLAH